MCVRVGGGREGRWGGPRREGGRQAGGVVGWATKARRKAGGRGVSMGAHHHGHKQRIGGSSVVLKQRIGGSSVVLKQRIGGSSAVLKQRIGGSSVVLKQRIGGSSVVLKQRIGGSSVVQVACTQYPKGLNPHRGNPTRTLPPYNCPHHAPPPRTHKYP